MQACVLIKTCVGPFHIFRQTSLCILKEIIEDIWILLQKGQYIQQFLVFFPVIKYACVQANKAACQCVNIFLCGRKWSRSLKRRHALSQMLQKSIPVRQMERSLQAWFPRLFVLQNPSGHSGSLCSMMSVSLVHSRYF